MHTRIRTIVALAVIGRLLSTVSCKENKQADTEVTTGQSETDTTPGKEYTAAYVCPMHCEGSGSETEGTCPKCGMAYVANEQHQGDGHKH